MKSTRLAAALILAGFACAATAATEKYLLDSSNSQVVFS